MWKIDASFIEDTVYKHMEVLLPLTLLSVRGAVRRFVEIAWV